MMTTLSRLKISTQLALGFGLLALLLVLQGATTLLKTSEVDDLFHRVINDRYIKVRLLDDAKAKLALVEQGMRNLLLVDSAAEHERELANIAATRKDIAQAMEQLQSGISSEKGRALLARTQEARAVYIPLHERFVSLARAEKDDEARALLKNELRTAQLAYFKGLDAMIDFQNELMQQDAAAAMADQESVQAAVLLVGALALLSAVTLGWAITRSVTTPIHRAVAVARGVAAGDLSQSIDAGGHNETAQLLTALKAMQTGLIEVVGRVRQNSESVATASAQIAQGNQDLSSRTEEQASALQQTAASMEQLNSSVQQNTDSAKQANQLAQGASSVAERGGQVVQEVVATMKDINESSRRIGDIIGVIDGIAFQTNILALNAAVEAARAGEQGRGFAVVAGEVRSLAQRSAEAAREIKSLIMASVERVEKGSTLADQAGSTMSEVVAAIKRVTDLMGEISAASVEQSSGVAQVGDAVSQMDQTTQQNAALVEESAAAAESLRVQATQLVEAVAVFRLSGATATATATAARQPTPTPTPRSATAGRQPKTVAKPPSPPAAARPAASAQARQPALASATESSEWESF